MYFSITSILEQKTDDTETTAAATLCPEESVSASETKEFRDSTAFLKGTQSMNPHNDYSQNFVDTGHRPQNFIRDVGLADRFEVITNDKEIKKIDCTPHTSNTSCNILIFSDTGISKAAGTHSAEK